jgi:RNA 3'-terminal phosphate cyclase (ATP)
MLEVDGSERSGSGTILRISVALAVILKEELHIYNIRKRRSSPGLRPQHLEAVLTAARLSGAEVKGAELGSEEIWFNPGNIKGGEVKAEIGTAGSIPMLILTVLPICLYAKRNVSLNVIKGGTDVRHAPTINYLKQILLPTLGKMGVEASLRIEAYGYYPKGMGEVHLQVDPSSKLKSLRLPEFGEIKEIRGLSVCTFLKDRRVAERQAEAAERHLRARGFESEIDILYDTSNPLQKGSSLVLWVETDTGVILGGDAIGELRKPSEVVGREAAENLLEELKARPTVDIHIADMVIPYIGLAEGKSIYTVRELTEHLDTNIWLTEKILGVQFNVEKVGHLYRVEKGRGHFMGNG